ncbi:MAG TPA: septum formation initiator family protein [Gemmatimonadaceae bacterium]|nr:septum formation initiator family protein [Gemmatimonadaceae bacterium]
MWGRVILWLLALGALVFAFQGGEYSTLDLWKQRQRKLKLDARVEALSREVDSLRRAAKAIQEDRATQERIAREQFGMVKGDKEILYRFADSVSR